MQGNMGIETRNIIKDIYCLYKYKIYKKLLLFIVIHLYSLYLNSII
jgi:hypothetical protein